MGLTMDKILKKYNECNIFSLTGRVEKCNITDEEYLNAISKLEEREKEEKRKIYECNKEKFINYPDFDKLYNEIKQECYYFANKQNRDEVIEKSKKNGVREEILDKLKGDFFHCRFIAEHVGKTTKYGNEHNGFFRNLYRDIAMNIDRENDKEIYCISNGANPIDLVPPELKEHLLYYEISFSNAVTISSIFMINYYFKLNDDTKKYLLKYKSDFSLDELKDLTLYKDKEVKFYSCTHEMFNSIEIDYKNMTNEEIIDYVKDEIKDLDEYSDLYREYSKGDKNKVFDAIKLLIDMDINNKFTFKDLGIEKYYLKNIICNICDNLNLKLICVDEQDNDSRTMKEDLSASFCDLDDLAKKIR